MPWPSDLDPDDELYAIIAREDERQNTTIQLIASENFTSPAVLRATGSALTNKYAEGYPGKRYYGGNQFIDEAESLAIERAKLLFGAEHANVQPHSGANANMAVYLGLLEPGDTILGLSLDHGGHLTHGSPVNASGMLYDFVSYKLSPSDERIDLDQVRDLARAHRPKMIVAGATAYPRRIEAEPFRAIADEVDALLLFDIAHIAGLIVGGAHPARSVSPTWSPSPRTRRCAAPAAAPSSPRPSWAEGSTRPSSPASRVGRWSTSSPRRRWPSGRPCTRSSATTRTRSWPTRPHWQRAWPARVPARLGRHRQPPDAGRSPRLRRRAHR